jgi:NAD(P)-dependent dehydrogenase (short-subunit alcohol dehydrogenase family)
MQKKEKQHMPKNANNLTNNKAYIITGPTSGIGLTTALEVAKHGTVVLVGRDGGKLSKVQKAIQQKKGRAVSVVCDLSDMRSVERAAADIMALNLPIVGLVNNAGIHQAHPTKSAQGWDLDFATNHLGPFVLTGLLMPHLPDGANVVFVASGVEDPERKGGYKLQMQQKPSLMIYSTPVAGAVGKWEAWFASTFQWPIRRAEFNVQGSPIAGLLESGKRGLLSTFQWLFRETEVGLVPLPMWYQ